MTFEKRETCTRACELYQKHGMICEGKFNPKPKEVVDCKGEHNIRWGMCSGVCTICGRYFNMSLEMQIMMHGEEAIL